MSSHVSVVMSPITIAVKIPVAVRPTISSMMIKIVRVPIATGASPVRIIRIGAPAWSTSIHTTLAGIVTVHKLSAFLVPFGLVPTTSLGARFVRSADEDQKCQPSNHEKVPESYKLHNLILRYLT